MDAMELEFIGTCLVMFAGIITVAVMCNRLEKKINEWLKALNESKQ